MQSKIVLDGVQAVLARARSLGARQVRDRERCFWVEGVRHFVQACDAGWDMEAVVYSEVLLKSDLAEKLARRSAAAGVRRVKISPEWFRKFSTGARASGVGAIVRQKWVGLEKADARRGLCWLVLERLRSPGNFGTILRTAEACGVGGVILVGPACDPFDGAVVRASMGGIFRVPLVRATVEQFGAWARRQGVAVVGLSCKGAEGWTEAKWNGPVALVVGEEREGSSARMEGMCGVRVRLPMTGTADSLNVGVAAGVMMYEMVRRRVSSENSEA